MKRLRSKEVRDARRLVPRRRWRTRLPSNRAFTTVLDRWLEQVAPGDRAVTPAQRRVRRLCGRWLAVRRYRLGISDATAVEQTGVSAQSLRWLELGLADATLASDKAWEQLCFMLTGQEREFEWVAVVIDTALGQRDACLQPVLTRVIQELRQMVGAAGEG